MTFKHINVDVEDRIYVVTINRPEVHNALNPDTNFELHEAFDRFETDPDLWVAIITGAGDAAFSVGGDISVMVTAKTDDDYKIPPSGYGGLTDRHSCHKPIIAAVNGMAFGGGFETALACDLVIASENASFGLPEPKIGTAAVGSGVHRIVRDIGLKPAMEMLLTGDPIDAQRAFELGLVNKIVPAGEVLNASRACAQRILKCAPLAVQASKQCALEGLRYDNVAAAIQAQRDGRFDKLEAMMKSEDIREGLSAFMEKRKPEWKGR
jgi:enoyl-CoA hydratase/carnithine racemase